MYELFSDGARNVMQLADQEAKRFNHEYIGTEHILLGLAKNGSGVAVKVLENLRVDLTRICDTVESIIPSGPKMILKDGLRLTPRAKKAIEYAMMEAGDPNHNYVGTEHILLGLLREEEAVAAQVLMNFGMTIDQVRNEVRRIAANELGGSQSGANHD